MTAGCCAMHQRHHAAAEAECSAPTRRTTSAELLLAHDAASPVNGNGDGEDKPRAVSGSLLFWAHTVPAVLALAAGMAANGGTKYVRLRAMATGPGDCEGTHWADVYDGPDGTVCCLEAELLQVGLCRAVSLNWTTGIMTQLWAALLVPVVGFLVNTGSQTPARVLTPREDVTTRHLRRFVLYAALVLWRTRVLYKGLKWVQHSLLGASGSDCWYASQTWRGVCRDGFDFSDHVVLFMAQYLAIQMFETFATLHENRKRVARVASAAVGTLVSFAALGGMFDTVAFFHTRTESLVGFAVAFLGTFLPLWVLMTGRAASRAAWLCPAYYINIAEECSAADMAKAFGEDIPPEGSCRQM